MDLTFSVELRLKRELKRTTDGCESLDVEVVGLDNSSVELLAVKYQRVCVRPQYFIPYFHQAVG